MPWAKENHLLGSPICAPLPGPGAGRQPRPHARGDHMSARLPRIALVGFVVGLAVHNLVMAELWDAGLRGSSLDVVAAWKDVLLAVALAVAILGARTLPVRFWADRLALVYAALVVVYGSYPELAGRRGDAARSALRRSPRPDPGRRVLSRAAARPHPCRLAPCLDRSLRRRRGGDRLGARRRLPRPPPVVARLGRTRLVRRAARARVSRPLRPARELGAEHGRRGEPAPATRLDVPQPARHRVRARDRPALSRRPPNDVVDDRGRRHRLCRPPLDAYARRVRRSRARARRARRWRSGVCSPSRLQRPSLVVGVAFVRAFPSSGRRRATRGPSSRTCGRRDGSSPR